MTFRPCPKPLPTIKVRKPLKKKFMPNDELSKTVEFIKGNMMKHRGYLYCQKCGSRTPNECAEYNNVPPVFTPLKPHHLVFRSEKPLHIFLHHHLNILMLFQSCHDYFHLKKSNRNELVKERRLDELFGQDILNK